MNTWGQAKDITLYLGLMGLLLWIGFRYKAYVISQGHVVWDGFKQSVLCERINVFLSAQLFRLGYHNEGADAVKRKVLLLFSLGSCSILYCILMTEWWGLFFIPLSAPLIGFVWYQRHYRKRTHEIAMAFPYFLDLLSLCLQAGIESARAIQELCSASPAHPLYQELSWALNKMRLGQSLEAAILSMGKRIQSPNLIQFAHALAQSNALGCALGDTVKELAMTTREHQYERAQQDIQKMPIRILLPLVLCIFPVVFIIVFMPLIIQLSRQHF